jgi:sugar phosphate isomerase/epimerase
MIKIASMVGAPDLEQETLAVYSNDLKAAFERLASLGYDGVELMTRDPHRLDGEAIHRSLDNTGLELAGLCTGHVFGEDGLGLVGLGEEIGHKAMERLEGFVDWAAEYGGDRTLVNIGRSRGPGYPHDAERTLSEMETAFRQLAQYAAPRGVRIVLEPINVLQAPYIHTAQDGVAMVERVSHPNFGLMVDTYHMNIEDVDIYDSFRHAKPYLWFVHFTDNNRHWPGSAHLDFRKIVAVLYEIAYAGFVSLEIMPWPDPDTAAESSIESLRRFIKPA